MPNSNNSNFEDAVPHKSSFGENNDVTDFTEIEKRRKIANPDEWKRNKNKNLRMSGKHIWNTQNTNMRK